MITFLQHVSISRHDNFLPWSLCFYRHQEQKLNGERLRALKTGGNSLIACGLLTVNIVPSLPLATVEARSGTTNTISLSCWWQLMPSTNFCTPMLVLREQCLMKTSSPTQPLERWWTKSYSIFLPLRHCWRQNLRCPTCWDLGDPEPCAIAICLFCSFAGSDGVYYFQSSKSCGRVSMLCTVICHVVTLRGFSGFRFRLRLPSRLVWLFPALSAFTY